MQQIDFIGNKNLKMIKANQERQDNILLEAEIINGSDYYKISLLDSIQIQINSGNKNSGTIVTFQYKISGDTIRLIEGMEPIDDYLYSTEMVIKGNNIYYLKDYLNRFDTSQTLKIKFNRLPTSGH